MTIIYQWRIYFWIVKMQDINIAYFLSIFSKMFSTFNNNLLWLDIWVDFSFYWVINAIMWPFKMVCLAIIQSNF